MQKAGCRWVGAGTSFLSPATLRSASAIPIPMVQTVDSIARASQLLPQAHVCTVETQNSILVLRGSSNGFQVEQGY